MRKALVLVPIVVVCSVAAFCGEYLMNDTGETVTGLRVVFSEPVTITGYGDVLMIVEPEGEATEFIFSGGEVEAWGGHWLNWEPTSTSLLTFEWLTEDLTTPQGLLAEQVSDQPIVTGNLLNPDYFAHSTYVMQGVEDRDKIFALSLTGVPELAFYPIVETVDAGTLLWSVEVSHPEGIGAKIDDDVLYIWGGNADWAGYGQVQLEVTSNDGRTGSVTLPVTVFRSDKTLINAEGKKNYFVPWSSQLDINRVLSVEEHMRKYNKEDIGLLDRRINWSRWWKMEDLKDVTKSPFWYNELVSDGFWNQEAQFKLIDHLLAELKDLGFESVRDMNAYYISTLQGNEIYANYDSLDPMPTKTDEEFAYFVNEAHRLGLRFIASNWIVVDKETTGGTYYEIWQANPSDINKYWSNYTKLTLDSMKKWFELGVDIAAIGNSMIGVGSKTDRNGTITERGLKEVAGLSRQIYPGPLTYFAGMFLNPIGNKTINRADFWRYLDILSIGVILDFHESLSKSNDPTLDEVINSWERRIAKYLSPFQKRYNKPFIAHENGCFPLDGSVKWGVYFEWVHPDPNGEGYVHPNKVNVKVDLSDQVLYFKAFFEAFKDMDGYYGPGVFWYTFRPGFMMGSLKYTRFCPRLKPVEEVFELYLKGSVSPKPIAVDGSLDEWGSRYDIADDPSGDNVSGDDIVSLKACKDDTYLYCGIVYRDAPRGNLVLWVDIDNNGGPEYQITCDIRRDNELWQAFIKRMSDQKVIGFGDIMDENNTLEVRVPRSFLEHAGDIMGLRADDFNASWSGKDDVVLGYWAVLEME